MKRLALLFVSFIAGLKFATAQPVSVGVVGGVPLIDQTDSKDESRPYVVGPSVEVRLPAGFALEADALYQRLGNTDSYQLFNSIIIAGGPGTTVIAGPATLAVTSRLRLNQWEFPVLGKYYFRRRSSSWPPFVGTGWAMRFANVHQTGTQTTIDADSALNTFTFIDNFRSDLQVGAIFAAGLRYHVGRFALLPQVRYTRWGGQNNILRKNEAGVFLGISF